MLRLDATYSQPQNTRDCDTRNVHVSMRTYHWLLGSPSSPNSSYYPCRCSAKIQYFLATNRDPAALGLASGDTKWSTQKKCFLDSQNGWYIIGSTRNPWMVSCRNTPSFALLRDWGFTTQTPLTKFGMLGTEDGTIYSKLMQLKTWWWCFMRQENDSKSNTTI